MCVPIDWANWNVKVFLVVAKHHKETKDYEY